MGYKESFIQEKGEEKKMGMVPHDIGTVIVTSTTISILGTLMWIAFSKIKFLQKLKNITITHNPFLNTTINLGDAFVLFALLGFFVTLVLYISQGIITPLIIKIKNNTI